MNILQTFEPNTKGRDFVIGDLHGAIAVLENLMVCLNFDKEKDRMFSVGDLEDRGRESLRSLGLLRESWFHAVMANHEQMMIQAFFGGYMGRYWWSNGGSWAMEAYNTFRAIQQYRMGNIDQLPHVTEEEHDFFDLLNLAKEMPFLITVNHKSGKKFHIIHAELPPGKNITDQILTDPDQVLELATTQTNDGDAFLWGRYQFMKYYGDSLTNHAKLVRMAKYKNTLTFNDNLSHIISGHTIMQKPITLFGQTNIDTCAYGSMSKSPPKWCGLTCIDLDTWTFYQATETEFRTVDPVVINKADLDSIES